MRFNFIGLAPHDVDAAAVRFPSGNAGSEAFVRIGNAAIVFFLKGVFGEIRIGVAPLPELLDELFALFVGGKLEKSGSLFRLNDVNHLFVKPFPVRSIEFFESLLGLPLALFLRKVLRLFVLAACTRGGRHNNHPRGEKPSKNNTIQAAHNDTSNSRKARFYPLDK